MVARKVGKMKDTEVVLVVDRKLRDDCKSKAATRGQKLYEFVEAALRTALKGKP